MLFQQQQMIPRLYKRDYEMFEWVYEKYRLTSNISKIRNNKMISREREQRLLSRKSGGIPRIAQQSRLE